jgi:hypothetical protein
MAAASAGPPSTGGTVIVAAPFRTATLVRESERSSATRHGAKLHSQPLSCSRTKTWACPSGHSRGRHRVAAGCGRQAAAERPYDRQRRRALSVLAGRIGRKLVRRGRPALGSALADGIAVRHKRANLTEGGNSTSGVARGQSSRAPRCRPRGTPRRPESAPQQCHGPVRAFRGPVRSSSFAPSAMANSVRKSSLSWPGHPEAEHLDRERYRIRGDPVPSQPRPTRMP